MWTPNFRYSFGWKTTRRADAHRFIYRATIPPSFASYAPRCNGGETGAPLDVAGAFSESIESTLEHDMEEIGLTRAALNLARR